MRHLPVLPPGLRQQGPCGALVQGGWRPVPFLPFCPGAGQLPLSAEKRKMDLPLHSTSVYAVRIREAAPCRPRQTITGVARMELFSVLGLADAPVLLAVLSLLAALVLSLFSLIRQGRGR